MLALTSLQAILILHAYTCIFMYVHVVTRGKTCTAKLVTCRDGPVEVREQGRVENTRLPYYENVQKETRRLAFLSFFSAVFQ